MFLLNFVVFVSWLADHIYVVLNNILSPRRGSPSLGLCIGTMFKKQPKQSPAALLQCAALLIGVYLGGTPIVWLDMSTHWALHLGVQPFASLFGPPQPYTSWLGSLRRGWAFLVVVQPSVSSLGPKPRRWAPCCWSAICVVVGLTAWLFGRSHGRCVRRVIMRPSASSSCISRSR